MKLQGVDGEYQVTWNGSYEQASHAKLWCHEQFAQGWGTVYVEGNEGMSMPFWRFTFKRLYHAQWFMMRWAH